MTTVYLRELGRWERCRVREIRENGRAVVLVLGGPAEQYQLEVPVYRLRAS